MFAKKKILSKIVLVSIFLLTGCEPASNKTNDINNKNKIESVEVAKDGFPIVEEEIELTILAPGIGLAEWGEMPTLERYTEKTKINLNYITPTLDEFSTRFNLMITSNDTPDMIFAPGQSVLTPALEVSYGEDGILLPLNDLIKDYAPNLNQLLKEHPEIKEAITTPDGNIYALPGLDTSDSSLWPTAPLWYRGDWLDALNAEVPETLDEFYNLLIRFRDEDPNGNGQRDEIPFSIAGLENVRPWLLGAFSLHEWGPEVRNDQVFYTPITDNAREYYKFLNQLFSEKLIDQDLFIQAEAMKKEKGRKNRLGIFQDWFSFFTTGQSETEAIKNPMFKPLMSEWSDKPTVGVSPQIRRGAFALSSGNKHPEASMRWVDYFYTAEGYEFMNRGPAGYYWDWEDQESGEKVLSNLAKEKGEDYRGTISPLYGIEAPGVTLSLPAIDEQTDSSFDDFIADETAEKIEAHGVIAFPLIYLTDEEINEISRIETDLSSYIEEQEENFTTGELDPENDEDWKEYLQTIEKMDIDRYIEIYQVAYDRQ